MTDRQPFIVHCRTCSHEWAPAFLPMEIGMLMKIVSRSICPSCGEGTQSIVLGYVPKAKAA